MSFPADSFGASIIVVGDFNPPIVSPDWLEKLGLIGSGDAEIAKSSESFIVSKDVARFASEWFALQVVNTQFSVSTTGVLSPQIKDFARGFFTVLAHVPVRAVGLNFWGHYRLPEDERHRIGDLLAPKNVWNKVLPSDSWSAGLEGLLISLSPFKRGEKPTGGDRKRVTIQPSPKVQDAIFLQVNNHYDIDEAGSGEEGVAGRLIEIIEKNWQPALEESQKMFEIILSQGKDEL